ncbi:MAG TPA: apolipoprotein N-acyltransferase [Acidobacteriota bacterium]|nr:apolipoprotein N-acyltransferase [Acidobacteriota bacterium]
MVTFLLYPAAGLVTALAFPDFSFFPLAWLSLIPLYEAAARRPSRRETVAGHVFFCLGYFGTVLYWIPGVLIRYGGLPWVVAALAWLLLVLILALFLLPFTAFLVWGMSRSEEGTVWAASGVWLFTELLRDRFPFGGFPWAALGYSQQPFPWLLQLADVAGVYLISFLLVLVNGSLWLWWRRGIRRTMLTAVCLCALACLYGAYRISVWSPDSVGVVRVGIAQGDIALMEGSDHYAQKYFRTLASLFDRAVAEGARWVIFPEAQNPYRLEQDFYFRTFWSDRASATSTYLLLNSSHSDDDGYYNSAYLINPTGEVVYRYDKIHLVPFGEYLPLERLLGKADALVAEVSSFRPGSQVVVGRVDSLQFGTVICFEAVFPRSARAAVRKGAQVLVNITNDGWFGRSAAPAQHFQMAVVRAVETRRPMIRAANTGFSAFISPLGEVTARTGLFEETVLVEDVYASACRTPYLVFGELPCWAVIILSIVLAAPLLGRNRGLSKGDGHAGRRSPAV